MEIPMQEERRKIFYREKLKEILEYTAVFAVSDFYAIELTQFLKENGYDVPWAVSVVGFDDTVLCRYSSPALTTVRQDAKMRAEHAISILQNLKKGTEHRFTVKLPVFLVERDSVKNLNGGGKI